MRHPYMREWRPSNYVSEKMNHFIWGGIIVFIKLWFRISVLFLCIFIFLLGTGLIMDVHGNDKVGYVFWLMGLILAFVYKRASYKARVYKDELIRVKARDNSRNNFKF